MGSVPREDPETGVTHACPVAPQWGRVPALCGYHPRLGGWSNTIYVHVDCAECRTKLKRIAEIEQYFLAPHHQERQE